MLHITDPTYLRYIFDGLESQSIQPENLAALPQGLVGIYEESIPAEQNVKLREKFLQFFSVWALLKKEVSASFVADLLNWKEQEVIDKLSTYTKWFNSPASATHILYHERLRAYLLSKITSNQLKQTNQKIIKSCQHALELKKGDEWETYALEYLPSHLLIPAMQDEEQGAIFRKLVYDTSYWNRQLEISKGYDWSKKMLNLAMVWAAKQNTDELIECALNKIDLHYMEQNDAPRIVELVAQNDIETALQRIESFGGNDKEGLQRKFLLYMLCLMELTLLESKDMSFRREAIEKILKHFNENTRIDHSILNWDDFFPSSLMFQMIFIWSKLNLDFLFINNLTKSWESDWIRDNKELQETDIELLMDLSNSILDVSKKIFIWCDILSVQKNSFLFNELYSKINQLIPNIKGTYFQNLAKEKLIEILIETENIELAEKSIEMSDSDCFNVYGLLNRYYFLNQEEGKANIYLNKIKNETLKIKALSKSVIYCCENKKKSFANYFMDKSISLYLDLEKESRGETIELFFKALVLTGKQELAELFIEYLFLEQEKNIAYRITCCEIVNLTLHVPMKYFNKINDPLEKYYCCSRISNTYFLKGDIEMSDTYFNLAMDEIQLISTYDIDDWDFVINPQFSALEKILFELPFNNEIHFDELIKKINNRELRKIALIKSLKEIKKKRNIDYIKKCLFEYFKNNKNDPEPHIYFEFCFTISKLYLLESKINNSVDVLKYVNDKYQFDNYLGNLINISIEKRDYESAMDLSIHFNSIENKIKNLLVLSKCILENSEINKSITILNEAIDLVKQIKYNDNLREKYYYEISNHFLNFGFQEKSLAIINKMDDDFIHKINAIIDNSLYYVKEHKPKVGLNLIPNLFGFDKDRALSKISIELCKHDLSYSIELTNLIINKRKKINSIINIISWLVNNQNINDSKIYLTNALNLVSNLDESNEKSLFLKEISILYSKLTDFNSAFLVATDISSKHPSIKSQAIIGIIISLLNQNINFNSTELIKNIEKHISPNYWVSAYSEIALALAKNKSKTDFYKIVLILKEYNIDSYLKKLSKQLIDLKFIDYAISVINTIQDYYTQIEMKIEIMSILSSNNFDLIRDLIEDYKSIIPLLGDNEFNKKNNEIVNIIIQLSNLEQWKDIESFIDFVSSESIKITCFHQIGLVLYQKFNFFDSLKIANNYFKGISNKEIIIGIINSLDMKEHNDNVVYYSIKHSNDNIKTIESLLEIYSYHKLFFSISSESNIKRLNRTLNIQWAIDIKSKFNQN